MKEYNENLHKKAKASTYENARALRKTQTEAEQKLWQVLRNNRVCDLKFRRQHPIDNYVLDFYCHKMKLAIEVDGKIHNDADVAAYDLLRTKNLNENGITVLRFTNEEVKSKLDNVIKKIEDWFEENDIVVYELLPNFENMKSNNELSEAKNPLSSRRGVGGEVNRLSNLFSSKQKNVLNIYCTAGYPQLNSTMEVMQAVQQNGADIIELGMPYSDPLADGEVIQKSSGVALANGMTIEILFSQLKNLRREILLPVILMGYMNPILQYGFEKFCANAEQVGIDGLILPDLPMYEFETEYSPILKKYNLDFIFLVTPETSEERVKKLDSLSSGFLYAVSSSSTTGCKNNTNNIDAYLQRLQSYQLMNPVLVGFGIKDNNTFTAACKYSNGAIIGSAYIKSLENAVDIPKITANFIKQILE